MFASTDDELTFVRFVLAHAQLLADWPLQVLDELAVDARSFSISKGEAVLSQGDAAEGFYIVAAGLIEVSFAMEDGRSHIRRYARPGTLFGLLGLFDQNGSPYSYVAQQEVKLLFVKKTAFLSILNRNPALWHSVVCHFSEFQRTSIADLEAYLFETISARLAQALISLATDPGKTTAATESLIVTLTQDELARLLGVSRQTISKELKRMEQACLIELDYRCITLLDTAALSRAAANPDCQEH